MFDTNVAATPPRNFEDELRQTYQGYRATAPGYYGLERRYQPLYNQLALNIAAQRQGGYTNANGVYQPGTNELNRQAASYQRAGNVSDALSYGPAASAALLRANPYLASSLNNLSARTANSGLLNTLNAQAQAGLNSGGALSSQDIRAANEQARAGFAQRGNLYGNQSVLADYANRDAQVRARQAAAQAFATNVQGQNQAQNDFVGRASQIFGTQLNPLAVLGLGGGGGGSTSSGSGSTSGTIGTGGSLFNSTNPYASDLYNTNYNAAAARNIANANNQAATNNAYLSAAASVAGALLSDRRLKTKIRKIGTSASGIPIKTWEYKTDPQKRRYVGAMAQDVEKVNPGAVTTDPMSGVKFVQPAKTDVGFGEVKKGSGFRGQGSGKRLDWTTGRLIAA